MVPPPNAPLAVVRETVAVEVANVARVAWMLASVGSGPRWNGLSAASADGATATATAPTTNAAPAMATLRQMRRGLRVRGDTGRPSSGRGTGQPEGAVAGR